MRGVVVSWSDPHTKILSVALSGLLLSAIILGLVNVGVSAAGTKFRVRGTVGDVNAPAKVFSVYITEASGAESKRAIQGNQYTVRVSQNGAQVLKANAQGALVRLGVSSIKTGDDVSILGTTRADGTLDAKTVVIR